MGDAFSPEMRVEGGFAGILVDLYSADDLAEPLQWVRSCVCQACCTMAHCKHVCLHAAALASLQGHFSHLHKATLQACAQLLGRSVLNVNSGLCSLRLGRS